MGPRSMKNIRCVSFHSKEQIYLIHIYTIYINICVSSNKLLMMQMATGSIIQTTSTQNRSKDANIGMCLGYLLSYSMGSILKSYSDPV